MPQDSSCCGHADAEARSLRRRRIRRANTRARWTPRSGRSAPAAARSAAWRWSRRRVAPTRTEWTCPMHPEIVRDAPGACPICGMALEPRVVSVEERNPELVDMTRRFCRLGAGHAAHSAVHGLGDAARQSPRRGCFQAPARNWIELVLATPVVLWGGWPFFERGWASIVNRSSTCSRSSRSASGAAYALQRRRDARSQDVFPQSFRMHGAGRRLLRGGGRHHRRWCCSGRCWSCARAAARARRFAALLGLAPKTARASTRRRERGRAARARVASAIGCACVPARRCRSTAS